MRDPRLLECLEDLIKRALTEGVEFEREAERYRMEGERAFQDAQRMKHEGRQRGQAERVRMLPGHPRAVDVRTNGFKDVADAKGDFVLFMNLAQTYASLAQMKFAKASALRGRA